MKQIPHFINNKSTESIDGKTFDSINPSTQKIWAKASLGSKSDTEKAVKAARDAFDNGPWPKMTAKERSVFLHKIADLIEKNIDELAEIETTDMGKPITQSRGKDIPRTVDNFRFFADYITLTEDESFPMSNNFHIYTRYEPVGVVAAISPWNFPIMLASWKIAPALAFGNTVVLKPAEQTPVSCYRLAEIAAEAGIPEGVLNVIHGFGPGSAGEYLTTNPDVDLVTFTGESNTARAIQKAVAPTLKGVSFELGGKGANIVFDDADMSEALDWSIRAVFTNAGQVCLAGSRLYVQENIYEEFLSRFVEKSNQMIVGDPTDPKTDIGPLASKEHYDKVAGYLDLEPDENFTIYAGGKGKGWWIKPTVITDVSNEMRVCKEEIFGPIVAIQPFSTEKEAIKLANDTKYGLNAMLFTENVRRAHRVAAKLRAGTVWVNCFFIRDLRAPFGGFGDSGIGREGGKYSKEFFTEPKAVVMKI
tara:strand:+ start:7676 stop:9103 length:1428 start_codon:yes stop_codon:yes gene_type:complete